MRKKNCHDCPKLREILHSTLVLYRFYWYTIYFKAGLSFCHGFCFLPGNLKTFWKFFAQKRKKFFSIAKVEKVIKQCL